MCWGKTTTTIILDQKMKLFTNSQSLISSPLPTITITSTFPLQCLFGQKDEIFCPSLAHDQDDNQRHRIVPKLLPYLQTIRCLINPWHLPMGVWSQNQKTTSDWVNTNQQKYNNILFFTTRIAFFARAWSAQNAMSIISTLIAFLLCFFFEHKERHFTATFLLPFLFPSPF